MKTTPEQRAVIREELRAYGPGDDLLDDLEEALARAAQVDSMREAIESLRSMHTTSARELALRAEVAALRAVAEAAKGVAAWTMHTDQSTRSGTLGMLRAALRAWEERGR